MDRTGAVSQMVTPMASIEPNAISSGQWTCLVVVGLVHTGLVYNLMYGAFQRLSAEAIAGLSFIYPLVAMLADYAVFDARLGLWQWAGLAMILLSLAGSQTKLFVRIRPGPSVNRGSSP